MGDILLTLQNHDKNKGANGGHFLSHRNLKLLLMLHSWMSLWPMSHCAGAYWQHGCTIACPPLIYQPTPTVSCPSIRKVQQKYHEIQPSVI